jgi:hypothetical protein
MRVSRPAENDEDIMGAVVQNLTVIGEATIADIFQFF